MFSKAIGAVFVCLAVHVSLAQDPTKVEPQLYKLAFENEWVQVVNVHYGPHEKSAIHDHPGGVVVILTGGHLKFTDQNGKTQEVYANAGESRWFPPFRHRVENLGDTAYNAVYIGIKNKRAPRNSAKAARPGYQPVMDAQTEEILSHYLLTSVKTVRHAIERSSVAFVMDQGADGLCSIVIKVNVPGSTGLLPLPSAGAGPNSADTTNTW